MEPQQHPQQQMQQQQQPNEDSSSSSNSKSNFLCRQSSTRWTPTTDQIRILKDLYYNNGIRSPSAEQIQRISARLRQYGKIEGKNVFYWFQNHKARERQKKRFTVDMAMQRGTVGAGSGGGWKPEDSLHNKYTSINPGVCSPSSSSPGVLGVGQMGSSGYGSFLMEKSFGDCSISGGGGDTAGSISNNRRSLVPFSLSNSLRSLDCSISGGGGDSVAGSISNNLGWSGMDPYSSSMYALDNKRNWMNGAFKEDGEQDEDGGEGAPASGMETLPLFPMHGEDPSSPPSTDWQYYNTGRYGAYSDKGNSGCSRTSLELTLNSYRMSPDSS